MGWNALRANSPKPEDKSRTISSINAAIDLLNGVKDAVDTIPGVKGVVGPVVGILGLIRVRSLVAAYE